MFLFFLGESIPIYLSGIAFIFSICIATVLICNTIKKDPGGVKSILPLAGTHATYPAIVFIVGRFIDLMIYSNSIGGIQGGTPYTFALMLSFPVMYIIGLLILLSIGYFSRRASASK